MMAAVNPVYRRPASASGNINPSRSRFHEGSMNDRASAVPPMQFLGPEDRSMLERPLSEDWVVHKQLQQQQQQQKRATLLGQVWDGVCERLRLRRDTSDKDKDREREREREREKTQKVLEGVGMGQVRDARPTREEVLANYQSLVESGFFTTHAIQSKRQPGPGTTISPVRPVSSPSPTTSRLAHVQDQLQFYPRSTPHTRSHSRQPIQPPPPPPQPQQQQQPSYYSSPQSPPARPRAQWPLSSPTRPPPPPPPATLATLTPPAPRVTSPFRSPASASSRGTKRGADDEPDPPTPKKKIRKSGSRDIAIPKLRSVTSRRSFLNRSVSNSSKSSHSSSREVAKRVFARLPGASGSSSSGSSSSGGSGGRSSARRSLDVPERTSSRRLKIYEANTTRVLRPRKSAGEPLCVVPDANRGIPNVPEIPAKWTFGEDRENDGSWRGLRR